MSFRAHERSCLAHTHTHTHKHTHTHTHTHTLARAHRPRERRVGGTDGDVPGLENAGLRSTETSRNAFQHDDVQRELASGRC